MKRTTNGMLAFTKIMGRELPEKTETYTPIAHMNVVNRLRSEIITAGYTITGEEYRCSNDGDVALGSLTINYKADPDLQLCANFLNSYNKQYAFRFSLGGVMTASKAGMILNNANFGSFKRVHKGAADLLAEGKISEYIKDSDVYWRTMIAHKDQLKEQLITTTTMHDILGELFMQKDLLNTMQLNTVKKEYFKPSFEYGVDSDSAYALYNHIAIALKDAHPASWLDHQAQVHDLFATMFGLEEIPDKESTSEFTEEEEEPASKLTDELFGPPKPSPCAMHDVMSEEEDIL
jgi:hypothetical protein